MKLWRLTQAAHTALYGAGTVRHGGRYSPPGVPVVNFASEAGLAVLVALRYLPGDPAEVPALPNCLHAPPMKGPVPPMKSPP